MTTRTTFAAALACILATVAGAQVAAGQTTANPIELGIDAGLIFGLDDPNTTTLTIPGQQVRAAFMFSPRISFEPALGLNYSHSEGNNATTYNAIVGMLYHLTTDRTARQLYVRPFVGVVGSSFTGSGSETQAALGAGFGVKMPLIPRLSARFEANYRHNFSSGDAASANSIGLLAGLSFFTR